jgi:phospholipid-binding lipoprotein MlaA
MAMTRRVRPWLVLSGLLLAAACGGCAAPRTLSQQDEVDRIERVNRAVYRFNRGVDRRILTPVAKFYDRAMPPAAERHVRKFFENLHGPTDIVNNLLQGKFRHGFAGLGRFLFNSTVGIGGFFDPAGKVGLKRHAEDFGQTLAVWGVPSGGYLMVPFLGPGSFRDWGALPIDEWTDGARLVEDSRGRTVLRGWRVISDRAALLPAERSLDESFDEYALVREAYWQHRRYQIYDQAPPVDENYLYLDSEP